MPLFLIVNTLLGCTKTLDGAIRSLSLQPLTYATTGYKPGQLVNIINEDPLVVVPVCDYENYVGNPKINTDVAASIQTSDNSSVNYSINAEKYAVGIGYRLLKSINVKLSNVSIETVSNDKVFSGRNLQSLGCTEAIEKADRSKLGFLQRALKGDGEYTITFHQQANLEAKNVIVKSIAGQIGIAFNQISSNRTTYQLNGSQLYWGAYVNRDNNLIVTPNNTTDLKPGKLENITDNSNAKIIKEIVNNTKNFVASNQDNYHLITQDLQSYIIYKDNTYLIRRIRGTSIVNGKPLKLIEGSENIISSIVVYDSNKTQIDYKLERHGKYNNIISIDVPRDFDIFTVSSTKKDTCTSGDKYDWFIVNSNQFGLYNADFGFTALFDWQIVNNSNIIYKFDDNIDAIESELVVDAIKENEIYATLNEIVAMLPKNAITNIDASNIMSGITFKMHRPAKFFGIKITCK